MAGWKKNFDFFGAWAVLGHHFLHPHVEGQFFEVFQVFFDFEKTVGMDEVSSDATADEDNEQQNGEQPKGVKGVQIAVHAVATASFVGQKVQGTTEKRKRNKVMPPPHPKMTLVILSW